MTRNISKSRPYTLSVLMPFYDQFKDAEFHSEMRRKQESKIVLGDVLRKKSEASFGNPAAHPDAKKGAQPPIFGPCLFWPNTWIDPDDTWHGV